MKAAKILIPVAILLASFNAAAAAAVASADNHGIDSAGHAWATAKSVKEAEKAAIAECRATTNRECRIVASASDLPEYAVYRDVMGRIVVGKGITPTQAKAVARNAQPKGIVGKAPEFLGAFSDPDAYSAKDGMPWKEVFKHQGRTIVALNR